MIIELPRRVPQYAVADMGWPSLPKFVGNIVDKAGDAGSAIIGLGSEGIRAGSDVFTTAIRGGTDVASILVGGANDAFKTAGGIVVDTSRMSLEPLTNLMPGNKQQQNTGGASLPAALQTQTGGPNWPLILGGAAALGIVAFALLRKKASP